MGHVTSLLYPKKSHRKYVRLPESSVELAEFFGIMIGDGGINNHWQAIISLNSIADAAYSSYVSNLCEGLFDSKPFVLKRAGQNTLRIGISSVTIVDFLTSMGLPRGNKLKVGLQIPAWILEKQKYKIACVRGLVDTDGCLYIHKHTVLGKKYQNIGFCFVSYSSELIMQVSVIFEEFGIIPHISKEGKKLYLYREKAIARYLEIFGTSNERIRSVHNRFIGGVG